jgi:hypothetical protein
VSSDANILTDAVARNAALVLSLPSAGMLRHHKSRFLRGQEGGIWVQGVPEDGGLVQQLITEQRPVGVALRCGEMKVMFATTLIGYDPRYVLQGDAVTEALLLKAPDELKVTQRRSNYRVRTITNSSLQVQIWRLPAHMGLQQVPTSHQQLQCRLRDLSATGAGFIMQPKQPPKLVLDERLRIELASSEPSLLEGPLLIEGRVRFLCDQPPENEWRLGVEFSGLQSTLEGRTTADALARLVSRLQRDELRRSRGAGQAA